MSVSTHSTLVDGGDSCILNRGHWFHLRPLRPTDRMAVGEAFRRLSPQSRQRRFGYPKKFLNDDELRFFTELDAVNHQALGAFELSGYGHEGELVGVARYIRLTEDCDVAEVAITVIDEFQARGLARVLLHHLALAGLRNGLRRFRFYFLADNPQMRALVARPCWKASFRNGGSLLAAECAVTDMLALPSSDAEPGNDTLEELLRLIGKGNVAAPLALSLVAARIWWEEVQRGLDMITSDTEPALH
jgi:RimJ/RimL family protein N-acetyltransferase